MQCHKDARRRRLASNIFSKHPRWETLCAFPVRVVEAKTLTTCLKLSFFIFSRWKRKLAEKLSPNTGRGYEKSFHSQHTHKIGLTTTEHAHRQASRHENQIIQFMFKSEKMSKNINNKISPEHYLLFLVLSLSSALNIGGVTICGDNIRYDFYWALCDSW